MVGSRQQPFGATLGDEVGQSPLGAGVRVNGESALKEGFEFLQVLFLDRDSFGEGNERSRLLAAIERHRALEMLAGTRDRIASALRPAHFVSDQEGMYRAAVPALVQLKRTVHEGLHLRHFSDEIRV